MSRYSILIVVLAAGAADAEAQPVRPARLSYQEFAKDPARIDALRRGMHECACKSDGSTVGRISAVPVPMAPVSAVLLELAMLSRQKKRVHR